jgi:limonene-1,2-epoxide hydrolase
VLTATPSYVSYRLDRKEEPDRGGAQVLRGMVRWHGARDLAAFFTDDAVYPNIPLAPITGREAIANTIATFIRPGPPGIEGIEFRVINIAANGPVVMTEWVDVFKLPRQVVRAASHGDFRGHRRQDQRLA